MVSKNVTLSAAGGFHMRPAGVFAGKMGKFECNVTLRCGEKTVDGKSLMNIIAACIKCGSELEVICDGKDEEEALRTAVELIESGLGE